MNDKKFNYEILHKCEAKIVMPYNQFHGWCMKPAIYHIYHTNDSGRSFWLCKEHFEVMKVAGKIGKYV